ncbi:uncharacterized protein At3g17950 [Dioscorea cayenensis subsp. rotundata]|uniref:Uncharacterized protein At3g17950 n=1 Tax=Dioscorea cayennensis subsp. rotundata TaxID=55577 RepID=A0AB40CCH5_DIOCR|nr:uncharacterized protein At3g17950 [Dioscorea cayenensis subsp. rotundata]
MAAAQENGWPLGLVQPVNVIMGLEPIRNLDFSGSLSSGNFCVTSSNSETESSISFFNDRSITLGSLIGFTSIVKTESLSLGYFLEVERRASNSSSLEKKPSSSSCLLCLCYSV